MQNPKINKRNGRFSRNSFPAIRIPTKARGKTNTFIGICLRNDIAQFASHKAKWDCSDLIFVVCGNMLPNSKSENISHGTITQKLSKIVCQAKRLCLTISAPTTRKSMTIPSGRAKAVSPARIPVAVPHPLVYAMLVITTQARKIDVSSPTFFRSMGRLEAISARMIAVLRPWDLSCQ